MDPSVKRVLFETLRPLMFSFTYHIDGNVLEKAMEKKGKKDQANYLHESAHLIGLHTCNLYGKTNYTVLKNPLKILIFIVTSRR